MAKIKLTKTAVESAVSTEKDYELRDTVVPGFLCKVTAQGRKIFMLQYRTNQGQRRKPPQTAANRRLVSSENLMVDQARSIAQDWLADVRKGNDPSAEKLAARKAPTVKELCKQMRDMARIAVTANRVLACLRKMLNMAEVWGYRPDGSNPCRHVPKYREDGETRYITNTELARLYEYLDRADIKGLEHPTLTLAVRLQFEFSARMSEIRMLEWSWIDFENRRIVWPDSKTGEISKPMSEAAYQLLKNAYRFEGAPYVCPSISDSQIPLPSSTYYNGWRRILDRARVPHVGTHDIRHRAATDIANSGVPIKVGMALTAHKTVSMFMTYVHTEDDPVRAAAEKVANLRRDTIDSHSVVAVPALAVTEGGQTRTGKDNYRLFRHRKIKVRRTPSKSKRALAAGKIQRLSADLTTRFGRGFSVNNLESMRRFFVTYPLSEISQTLSGKSENELTAKKSQTLSGKLSLSELAQAFPLPWSAYVRLLSVEDVHARQFYETEALRGGWSVRQLDRQISSQFYERTALSKDKAAMLAKGAVPKPADIVKPDDAIKDPYVLEFFDLKDEYSESDLEAALIQRLEDFLLELGEGFTFVGRQRRLRIDQTWYRVDLLLFHRRLRCLVIIDLKLGSLFSR